MPLQLTRRHVQLCYIALGTALACRLGLGALHALVAFNWQSAGCCDAAVDWRGAGLALQGLSPYELPGSRLIGVEHKGFGHPPTAVFWFLPLAKFSHAELGLALALLTLVCLAVQVHCCVKELAFSAPRVTSALLFAFLWTLSGIQLHLTVIQTSIPLACCCVLAWGLLRNNRELLGGIALGVACTLKLFPGLLVLFLLVRGRFRAVAAAACTWGVVAAVMTWRFGIRSWAQFFEQQGPIAQRWIGHTRNASLHGVMRRAFTDTCGGSELSEATLSMLTALASLAVVGAALFGIAFLAQRRSQHDFDFAYALLCAVAPFVNPWVWEHYITMLLLPLLFATRVLGTVLNQTWLAWVSGTSLGLRSVALATAAVAALGMLAVAMQFQMQEWHAKSHLTRQICSKLLPPAVQAWSEGTHRYLEHTNWLTWPLVLIVLVVVGALFLRPTPAREPVSDS